MSFRNRNVAWWVAVAAILGVVVLAVPLAVADDDAGQLAELRQQVESMDAEVDEGIAAEDFERAYRWIGEAEEAQQRGNRSALQRRLRRLDHMVDLLRVRTQIESTHRTIEQQRRAYQTSDEQIERLKAEIEDLQAQVEERQQELRNIQADL